MENKPESSKTIMETYTEFIKRLSKEDLQTLILGDDEKPPMITRDEPKWSRPQLIWALTKLNFLKGAKGAPPNFKSKSEALLYSDYQADEIINTIVGHKWDNFFKYDYARFDIRKPGFRYVLAGLLLAIFGAYCLIKPLVIWVINLF